MGFFHKNAKTLAVVGFLVFGAYLLKSFKSETPPRLSYLERNVYYSQLEQELGR